MALTTIQTNNKLIKFQEDVNREFVRENMFSPYYGEGLTAIIRYVYDLKSGGEQINLPLLTKATNSAIGVGTLVGNEEKLDNYGMRVWIDWARNAVVTNKAENQKDSADIFSLAKPVLTDWGKELQRDEMLGAFMALPSESSPTGLGANPGQRINGILFQDASNTNRTTWSLANIDRVLFGNVTANNVGSSFATDLAKVKDDATDNLLAASVSLMKRMAKAASPAIRPYRTEDGYEHYVLFAGLNAFRDLKASLASANGASRPRENGAHTKNPIFNDGDLMWDGVIVREVPEISGMVTDVWTSLATGGISSKRVEPVFFCGQQAAVMAWGQMAKPTSLAETDYEFRKGVGIEMAYGTAKMFKKHPSTGSNLVQWGVLTGFYSAVNDA